LNAKVLIVLVFIAATAAVVYFARFSGQREREQPAAAAAPKATEITFLYGSEKKDWVESAVADFRREHPSYTVNLQPMGSLEAAQSILEGKDKPTLWSPADSLALNLLSADWRTRYQAEILAGGEDAPQPLVITPLVWVIWEDRASALTAQSGGRLTWKTIHDALVSNRGWPAFGGKESWGFVKLGHTDPTRSNSGLQALVSMSLEFHNKRALEIGDVLKPDYQQFIREIESGVTQFELSTGTFMTDMIRFGPSKYDIAVVYESLAVSQLENAQGRWGNLKVFYPATTLWSDHPVALLQGDWVTEDQKKVARELVRHLRSRQMQERALQFGFRPGDPAVPIKGADANNPITRAAQYGVQLELPPAANTPDGAVVRNLMTMWSRVVRR
jgi:Bacterial extracellular solute-binding protein